MHFNDLPLEIIQHVFRLRCRRSVKFRIPQDPKEPERARSRATQVVLSLVCSKWREIALNTSVLWGNVEVIYDARREQAWSRGLRVSLKCVQIWLKRAGTTPISLNISVYGAWEAQIAAISRSLLSSFHVTNLDLASYRSYLLGPTNNSSRLKRLHLSLDRPMDVTVDVFPRLPEMPSLTELHLSLHPPDFGDLTNIYLIPWHQLRVFTVSKYDLSSQMFFDILPRCKSLVECTLLMTSEDEQHEHDIVLPNLERLHLDLDGSADLVIRSLTVPNLRSLEIKSWSLRTKLSLSPEAVVIMAQRSGFDKRLTNISLCLTEQPVDVRSLLESMPALERMKLRGPLLFQPGIFDDLSSGTIGPQLAEIYFGVMSDEEIGLVLDTVGQRHEKAKTVSDIRPFASVTCCTSGSDFESHKKRAKQCGKAFNAHVEIQMIRVVSQDAIGDGMPLWDSDESDSDISMGSASDEESYVDEESYIYQELCSILFPGVVFTSGGEPLEESRSVGESESHEESRSVGESESHEESHSVEDSGSESHEESDPDVDLDSQSGDDSQSDA